MGRGMYSPGSVALEGGGIFIQNGEKTGLFRAFCRPHIIRKKCYPSQLVQKVRAYARVQGDFARFTAAAGPFHASRAGKGGSIPDHK